MEETGQGYERIYGGLLVGTAALMVFGMMHHPTVSAGDSRSLIEALARQERAIAGLHGALLLLLWVQAVGFYGLTRLLGARRPFAAAGFILFAASAVAMTNAAVLNGLAAPAFAASLADAPEAEMAAAGAILRMNWSLNQAWDLVGALGWSAAVLCWSAALLREAGAARWLGIAGLAGGSALAAALAAGAVRFDAQGFGATVAALCAFTAAAGVLMIAGRLSRR
jgi:hypothetical protein